jgi:hypothetical protein
MESGGEIKMMPMRRLSVKVQTVLEEVCASATHTYDPIY